MAKTGTLTPFWIIKTVIPYPLFERLQTHHGVSLTDTTSKARLRVAINEAFAEWDTPCMTGMRLPSFRL